MAQFQTDDLERTLTQEARDAICDLTLSWAAFDTMVSYWMILMFGMEMDIGSILLGNMDTKTKIDRMKLLCVHLGATDWANAMTGLSKEHAVFVDARNTVTHRRCVGMLRSDPCRLVFTSVKHRKGEIGVFEMSAVDVNEIKAAVAFAENAVDKIMEITEPIAKRRDEREALRREQRERSAGDG